MRLEHPYEPIFDSKSTILILGTFPSIKSREYGFYYGHPQNRFWKILTAITRYPWPATVEEKKRMLLNHGIALADIVQSCEIEGSCDSKIKNPVARDLFPILSHAPVKCIYTNGTKAHQILKHQGQKCESTEVEVIALPSTSPANAIYTLDKLIAIWKQILFK